MQTMILGGCKAAIKLNIIDLDFKPFDIGFNIKKLIKFGLFKESVEMYLWKCGSVCMKVRKC